MHAVVELLAQATTPNLYIQIFYDVYHNPPNLRLNNSAHRFAARAMAIVVRGPGSAPGAEHALRAKRGQRSHGTAVQGWEVQNLLFQVRLVSQNLALDKTWKTICFFPHFSPQTKLQGTPEIKLQNLKFGRANKQKQNATSGRNSQSGH